MQTPTTAILTATTTTSSSQSRSTTCSDDDLEEIDEEPSNNLDDEDLYEGEVSYDEYDDSCNKNHFDNNNEIEKPQLTVTKDLNARFKTVISATTGLVPSLAHHINLDNCYVNNNNNQQQQEREHRQQNLLSPNANSDLKSITNSGSLECKGVAPPDATLSNDKKVITTQPTSPNVVKTSKCNNTGSGCNSSGSAGSQLHQQNSHHNQQPQLQQRQQLNHNNSPMKRLKQIENLHTNSHTNLNSNLNSIQTPAPHNAPLHPTSPLYPVLSINNTSITKTQTQPNIVASAATTTSISQPTPCTAITTTATTIALSPPPHHSTTRSYQNQLQNQNQNISSSLEIILSPIIQSSRR